MLKRIPLASIYGNPDQPRKSFDDTKLRELAASIRENGLKQPITVRAENDGRFMIVMGERRFRAHQILAETGRLSDILCHVSKADDAQLSIDAIIENDQRVDVEPLEQARSYQRMIDDFGFTLETLSIKLGKAPFRITERLSLLKLTAENQFLLAKGQINPSQAWYLCQLSEHGQSQLIRAITKGLCSTMQALKMTFETIQNMESQVVMFEMPVGEPTKEDRDVARGFEAKVQRVADMLNAGIKDNEIVAIRLVDPTRAGTLANLFQAMQKDLQRLENSLRLVAVQQELAA